MTTDQSLALIYAQIQQVLEQLQMASERQLALSRATRRLADAQSAHLENHEQDDAEIRRLSDSVNTMIIALGKLYEDRYSKATAEELSRIPFDTLCRARTIAWGRTGTPMSQPPNDLPPAPHNLVPSSTRKRNDEPTERTVERRKAKRRKDDSVNVRVDSSGTHVDAHMTKQTFMLIIKKVFPWFAGPGIAYAWHLWHTL